MNSSQCVLLAISTGCHMLLVLEVPCCGTSKNTHNKCFLEEIKISMFRLK